MARTRAKNAQDPLKKKKADGSLKKTKATTKGNKGKGKGKGKASGSNKTPPPSFDPMTFQRTVDARSEATDGRSGPWTMDCTREPRICSERRVIAKNHVCYLRLVSLFSEATGARFNARQFCIERSYVNRNTGNRDQFIFTLNVTALPALILAAKELNEVRTTKRGR